jgi:hypothetical protein
MDFDMINGRIIKELKKKVERMEPGKLVKQSRERAGETLFKYDLIHAHKEKGVMTVIIRTVRDWCTRNAMPYKASREGVRLRLRCGNPLSNFTEILKGSRRQRLSTTQKGKADAAVHPLRG